MELVFGASTSMIKSLSSLISKEYAMIGHVQDDVHYITDELETMYAFLLDLNTAAESHDNRTQNWMKKIHDITFDTEDCIREFGHRVPHNVMSDARCSNIVRRIYELWTWRTRRDIASKIANIKVQVKSIAERRYRYEVRNPIIDSAVHAAMHGIARHQLVSSHSSSNRSGVLAATYEDIADHQAMARRQIISSMGPVVVVTTDMEKLEKWLGKTDPERAVLSIVGFGGMGKTTIATALYREVRNKFDCCASVTVSQNYDQDAVMRSILNQVLPQDRDQKQHGGETGTLEKKKLAAQIRKKLNRAVPLIRIHRQQGNDENSDVKPIKVETMDHDQLVYELKKQLADKRYLLLIDDIWSVKTWDSIRICLPADNNRGSRIIVTSRFQGVGATCSPNEKIDLLHTIDPLTDDESKMLFNQGVSESKSSKYKEIVENHVAGEIWKICGGLPLAIVTMAGLVACNPSKPSDDWHRICKSLFPNPVTSLTFDGVTRILDCCYNDLPADLKTCSLYLSIFPKGWKISRKRLTRRWIAEGFISEKQGLTEEEVAELYFNQIIRRNIVRPVEHSSNGKVKTFQVHDMVLEYIISKSFKENCVNVVGGHWTMPVHINNKVRRLSIQSTSNNHWDLIKGMDLSRVRSFTVFGSLNQQIFHSFNHLIIQLLDLEGWKGLKDKHLNSICKMLSLKYLSLRRTEITKFPPTIGNLSELETRDIRETNVGELPKAVGQLKRISSILGGNKNQRKGLRLPQDKSKDPRKSMLPQEKSKDGMKALRVLSGIEIIGESTAIAGLHQLTGLRKFAIYKLSIKKDGDTFKELRSSIEYLGSCGLQTLAINDEGSDFINSLDSMSAPPIYLIALELSGKLESPPKWITRLHMLNKLTLSVAVLRTDTLELICTLLSLFSLTFSLHAVSLDQDTLEILEKNKEQSDGEIFVPAGFPCLKLLRFFSPLVPKLGFSDNAMPSLEMIDMRFDAFEGLLGIDTLENLKEVHLRVSDQADETTKFFVDDLKSNTHGLKVIVDHVITA